jgi:hypothetical protein
VNRNGYILGLYLTCWQYSNSQFMPRKNEIMLVDSNLLAAPIGELNDQLVGYLASVGLPVHAIGAPLDERKKL